MNVGGSAGSTEQLKWSHRQ